MTEGKCPECGGLNQQHYLNCSTWDPVKLKIDQRNEGYDNSFPMKRETGWWVVPAVLVLIAVIFLVVIYA